MTTIEKFKNIHDGKRLFILASGPSLGTHDLSKLDRRIVMGLNRSVLTYPDTHYHCVMDLRLFEEFDELLHRVRYMITLEDRPWGIPLHFLGSEGFSWDLEKGIYSGYTVAYFALQVAVYMGFKEVYYLGLDLRHEKGRTHFFGHDYHSASHEQTEFPRMDKMLNYGAKVVAKKGIKVFNCSPISTLECFPKVSFDHAVSL